MENKIIKGLLLIVFLMSSNAWADEECNEINVIHSLPFEMRQFFGESRDQGAWGWCASYAAADLLSFKLQTPVSALHTALIFNSSVGKLGRFGRSLIMKDKGLLEGATVSDVLEAAREHQSICSESSLSSEDFGIGELGSLVEGYNNNGHVQEYQAPFQMGNVSEKQAFDLIPGSRSVDHFILRVADKSCEQKKISVPSFEVASITPQREKSDMPQYTRNQRLANRYKQDFLKKIDAVLDSNRPLAASFAMSMISDDSGGHAAIITGRRKVSGKCQYIIRNSWGGRTSGYKDNITTSSSGRIFVSRDDLYKYTYFANYIP